MFVIITQWTIIPFISSSCYRAHVTCSLLWRPVFAWEAYEKGTEVHLQADPTKLELLHQSFRVKKEDFKNQQKESILEKVQPNTMLAVYSSVRSVFLSSTVLECECCMFVRVSFTVRGSGASGRSSTRAAVGSDRGLRGVLSTRSRHQGPGESHSSLQIRRRRPY